MPDSFSVSQIDVFRAWEKDPEADLSWLMKALSSKEETADMRRGTAFHKALENFTDGEVDRLDANGYTFMFDGDFDLPSITLREVRGQKNYGGIEIRGRIDGVLGKHILDHKAATWFDAERYFAKYQWRYYLDIFNADRFTWYIWEMQEQDDPMIWTVRDLHVIEQYRYPELEKDCKSLAQRLRMFAEQYLVTETA